MVSVVQRLHGEAKSFGWLPTLTSHLLRLGRRTTQLKLLKCMSIASVSPAVLKTHSRYSCRFLSVTELRRWSHDPAYELDESFLAAAEKRGDECFGIVDSEVLAAYGWYSHGHAELESGWTLRFPDSHVYMFKGFTHPAYRGQRLHAVGMGRALNEYRRRGLAGIVSYVEAHNLASLKSCYRMGYEDIGRIWLWGRRIGLVSQDGAAFGLAIAPASAQGTAEVEMREPLAIQRR